MLIACKVTSAERDAWMLARQQLRAELVFDESEKADVVVISLLPEVENPEPLDAFGERLRADVRALSERNVRVVLCSVFRVCDDARMLERIRRLNLLGALVSHETGAEIIDFDRVFAHAGARELQTDYRLGGPQAAQLAAQAILEVLAER